MSDGLLAGIGAGLTSATQSYRDMRQLIEQERARREQDALARDALKFREASEGLKRDEFGNYLRDPNLQKPLSELERANLEKTKAETGLINKKLSGKLADSEALDAQSKALEIQLKKKQLAEVPGQKAVDTEFGKNLAEFEQKGGFAEVQNDIGKLRGALAILQGDKEKGIPGQGTGGALGVLPRPFREALSPTREKLENDVKGVILKQAKLILGPQFTEKDLQTLLDTTINPRAKPEVTAARIENLINNLEDKGRNQQASLEYFRKTGGTLAGFQGAPGLLEAPQVPNPKDVEQYAKQNNLSLEQAQAILTDRMNRKIAR